MFKIIKIKFDRPLIKRLIFEGAFTNALIEKNKRLFDLLNTNHILPRLA